MEIGKIFPRIKDGEILPVFSLFSISMAVKVGNMNHQKTTHEDNFINLGQVFRWEAPPRGHLTPRVR